MVGWRDKLAARTAEKLAPKAPIMVGAAPERPRRPRGRPRTKGVMELDQAPVQPREIPMTGVESVPSHRFHGEEPRPQGNALGGKPMTFEELVGHVTDMARNGEGADKFRALKMVQSWQNTDAVLPEPKNQTEAAQRLWVLLECSDLETIHNAYHRAYGTQDTKKWQADLTSGEGAIEARRQGVAVHETIMDDVTGLHPKATATTGIPRPDEVLGQ